MGFNDQEIVALSGVHESPWSGIWEAHLVLCPVQAHRVSLPSEYKEASLQSPNESQIPSVGASCKTSSFDASAHRDELLTCSSMVFLGEERR